VSDYWVEWVIGVAIALIIALLGIALYIESNSETIVLIKAEWHCTKTERETHLQPTLVGKVTTLVPITRTACVEYAKNT